MNRFFVCRWTIFDGVTENTRDYHLWPDQPVTHKIILCRSIYAFCTTGVLKRRNNETPERNEKKRSFSDQNGF